MYYNSTQSKINSVVEKPHIFLALTSDESSFLQLFSLLSD